MNFRFENIIILNLLWLVLAFHPFFLLLKYWREQKAKAVFGRTLSFLTSTNCFRKKQGKFILEGVILVLMIIAYARPQSGGDVEKIQRSGIEVILAIDVSLSMLTEDVKPNRLDLAKKTLKRILDQSVGHKVGLLAFAGSSALISPLTSDYSTLAMYIDSISTTLISRPGTHFTQALDLATESFKQGGLKKNTGLQVSRAVIVVSDGEDNEPGALQKARELAQKEDLHIYTIAVGTKQGAPIPLRDQFGQLQGYKKDKSQKTVLSRVQDDLLKQMALVGGGNFTYATFSGNEVKLLLDDLEQLEKEEFEEEQVINYKELFQWLLAIALLLMFLELLLSEKKVWVRSL